MRGSNSNIWRYLLWILATAVVLVVAFLAFRPSPADTIKAAQRTEKALGKRMAALDSYIESALAEGDIWIGSLGLPEDMVIYRYIEDTLQSWCNQFPVRNDDMI